MELAAFYDSVLCCVRTGTALLPRPWGSVMSDQATCSYEQWWPSMYVSTTRTAMQLNGMRTYT